MRKPSFAIIFLIMLCAPALAGGLRMIVTPPENEHEPEQMQTVRAGDTIEIELSEQVLILGGPHDFYGLMYTGRTKSAIILMTINPNREYLYMNKVQFTINNYSDTFRIFGCQYRLEDYDNQKIKITRME